MEVEGAFPVPLRNYVVVEEIEETKSKKTEGGVYIPEGAQVGFRSNMRKARVVAVGPGLPNATGEIQRPGVHKDDIVVYPNKAGSRIKVDDKVYLLLADHEIILKLDFGERGT